MMKTLLFPAASRNVGDCRMLLSWAKELNCNFIRLAHYPHNEEESHACRFNGFIVMGRSTCLLDD